MTVMQFHFNLNVLLLFYQVILVIAVAATLIFWHIKDFVSTAVECCAVDPFIAVCMCMCVY